MRASAFLQVLVRAGLAEFESRSVGPKPNETLYEPGGLGLTLSQDGLLTALSRFPPPKLFDKLVNSRARLFAAGSWAEPRGPAEVVFAASGVAQAS
jgi:hypothetical protein